MNTKAFCVALAAILSRGVPPRAPPSALPSALSDLPLKEPLPVDIVADGEPRPGKVKYLALSRAYHGDTLGDVSVVRADLGDPEAPARLRDAETEGSNPRKSLPRANQ